MTATQLIRVPIDIGSLAQWAGERGWAETRRTVFDEGVALHHLVTEAFGPGSFSCFRLLVPPRKSIGNLYGYSAINAETLCAAARTYAMPENLKVLRLERMMGKPMPKEWRIGQRVGFDLRVRPVRRLLRALNGPETTIDAGKEVDAFLLEALRDHPDALNGMEKGGRTREAVYLDWLAERIARGAQLDRSDSRVARFRRVRVVRGNHDSEGPDVTVHGILTITDPTSFSSMLAQGIGRHRSYGYGMLLLRPANKTVSEC